MIWVIETVMTTNGICLFIGNAKLRMTGRSSCDSNSKMLGRRYGEVFCSRIIHLSCVACEEESVDMSLSVS